MSSPSTACHPLFWALGSEGFKVEVKGFLCQDYFARHNPKICMRIFDRFSHLGWKQVQDHAESLSTGYLLVLLHAN